MKVPAEPNPSLKRVLVRHRSPDAQLLLSQGFAAQRAWETTEPLHLLSPEGLESELPWERIEGIFLVNEFDQEVGLNAVSAPGLAAPARRPAGIRMPGLRVRVRSRTHWVVEGMLASGLLDPGEMITLTPTTSESRWQRLLIPRGQVIRIEPLEVVRASRRRSESERRTPLDQLGLFSDRPNE